MKVVVNRCFGGFGLSPRAIIEIHKRKGVSLYFYKTSGISKRDWTEVSEEEFIKNTNPIMSNIHAFTNRLEDWKVHEKWGPQGDMVLDLGIARDDPELIAVVEEIGQDAAGYFAELEVVEIPDGTSWYINEYDGLENVAEGRTW